MNDFIWGLTPEARYAVAQVSEDVPLAVRDLGGLVNPCRKLLGGAFQYAMAAVIVAQIFLNIYSAVEPVYSLFAQDGLLAQHEHSVAKLLPNGLTICYQLGNVSSFTELNLRNKTFLGENGCLTHDRPHELLMQQFIAIVECLVILSAVVPCALSCRAFLCSSTEGKQEFLRNRPFILVMLPKLAGTTSLLKGLTFANTSFIMRSLKRGDLYLYRKLLAGAWCPRRVVQFVATRRKGMRASWAGGEGDEAAWDRTKNAVDMFLRVVLCGVSTIFALLALRGKFNMLYFVSTVSWHKWGYRSWLLALGFANQIASIIDLDMYEFMRILVFKFGGMDAEWSKEEVKLVEEYFALVFSRFAGDVERVSRRRCAGLRTLAALITFNSDRLQSLLLSEKREHAIKAKAVRDERCRIITEVMFSKHTQGGGEELHVGTDERCGLVQKYWKELLGRVDAENDRLVSQGPVRARVHTEFLELAEKTRLLALLQSHMGDVYTHTWDEDDDSDGEGEDSDIDEESSWSKH